MDVGSRPSSDTIIPAAAIALEGIVRVTPSLCPERRRQLHAPSAGGARGGPCRSYRPANRRNRPGNRRRGGLTVVGYRRYNGGNRHAGRRTAMAVVWAATAATATVAAAAGKDGLRTPTPPSQTRPSRPAGRVAPPPPPPPAPRTHTKRQQPVLCPFTSSHTLNPPPPPTSLSPPLPYPSPLHTHTYPSPFHP